MKHNLEHAALSAANALLPTKGNTASLRTAAAFSNEGVDVDEAAGVIRGAAVMKIGPAEGHGFSIDATTLKQMETLGNAGGTIRVRFQHPDVSVDGQPADDLGSVIGYVDNLRISGDTLRGDVHIEDYASHLPGKGDVKTYLLKRAMQRPGTFGLSAVIGFDTEPVTNAAGDVIDLVARVMALDAIDFVGRGAATPDGLLSAQPIQQTIPAASVLPVAQPQKPAAPSGAVTLNTKERFPMDPKLKQYLAANCGLAADATDEDAQKMFDAMTDEKKAEMTAKVATMAAKPAKPAENVAQLAASTHEAMLAAEGKRVTMLSQLGEALRLDTNDAADKAVIQLAIAEGDDVPAARTRYLKRLQDKCKPVEGLGGVKVGEDRNIASLRTALPQAMLMKIGTQRIYAFDHQGRIKRDGDGKPVVDKVDDRAHELASLRMRDVFREYLSAIGVDAREVQRLGDGQLVKAFNRRGLYELFPRVAQLAQGVDDFDSVLANVQNKSLRIAYMEMTPTWSMWCGQRTTDDFKTLSDVQMSDVPNLVAKDEHGRYRRVQVSDSKETWSLAEYGIIIALTRRALLNDDLNVFSTLAQKQAAAARRLEETRAYLVLTANAAMNDTVALFHATHSNLEATTANVGAPSVTTLGAGRAKLRKQTGPKGAILDLLPKYLLVPAALENVAEQYTSANFTAAVSSNINPFAATGRTPLIPIVQPRLDTDSATSWYLAADKTQIDTVKLCFLSSEPEPQLTQNQDFHTDDLELKVRHSVAAAALDHRGLYKNPGA